MKTALIALALLVVAPTSLVCADPAPLKAANAKPTFTPASGADEALAPARRWYRYRYHYRYRYWHTYRYRYYYYRPRYYWYRYYIYYPASRGPEATTPVTE